MGESADTVSEYMTAIWNNFSDGSDNLERYADVLTKLGATTASSAAEIAEGVEKFAAVGDTVGLSYDYAASALATITAQTRQSADVVGTALKTVFARIQDLELGETLDDGTSLGTYSQALEKVGVNIKDASGDLKDMDTILDETAAKWSTLSKDTQMALAETVAGTRQYTQFVALMDNWDAMQQNLETAATSEGTLQEQQDIYAESWEAASDRVQAALESIYSKLIDDDAFITGLDHVAEFIDIIDTLVDKLGGLGGVVTKVIVPAFLALFGNNITSGIQNTINNIKVATGLAQKEAMATKEQANAQVQAMAFGQGDQLGDTLSTVYGGQAEVQQTYLAVQNKLNSAKQEEYKIQMQLNDAVGQEAIKQAEAATAAEEAVQAEKAKLEAQQSSALAKASSTITSTLKSGSVAGMGKHESTIDKQANSLMMSSTNSEGEAQGIAVVDKQLEDLGMSYSDVSKKAAELRQKLSELDTSLKSTKSVTEKQQILNEMKTTASELSAELKKLSGTNIDLKGLETANKALGSMKSSAKAVQAAIKESPVSGVDFKEVESDLNNILEQAEAVSNAIGNNPATKAEEAELNKVITQYKEALKAAEEFANANGGRITDTQKKALSELSAKIDEIVEKTSKMTSAQISNSNATNEQKKQYAGFAANCQASGEQTQTAARATDNFSKSQQKLISDLEAAQGSVINWKAAISSLGSTLLSVNMMISTISSAVETIKDPDTSGWEKASAVMMALGMSIMSVSGILGSFNKVVNLASLAGEMGITVVEGATTAELKKVLAQKLGTAATENLTRAGLEQAVVEQGLEGKITLSNAALVKRIALQALANPLIVAATVAVAALTVGILAYVKAQNAEEDALEASTKKLEESTEKAEETQQAYDDLQSSLDDIADARSALDEMTEGTDEWREAVEELNQKVLELIQTYPELDAAVTNVNGVLGLDTTSEAYQNYINERLQESRDALSEKYNDTITNNQNQNAVDIKEAASNIKSVDKDLLSNIVYGALKNGTEGLAALSTGVTKADEISVDQLEAVNASLQESYGIQNLTCDQIFALSQNLTTITDLVSTIAARDDANDLLEDYITGNDLMANEDYANASEAEQNRIIQATQAVQNSASNFSEAEIKQALADYLSENDDDYQKVWELNDKDIDKYLQGEDINGDVNKALEILGVDLEDLGLVAESTDNNIQDVIERTIALGNTLDKNLGEKATAAMFGLSQGGDFSNLNKNEIDQISSTSISTEQAKLLGFKGGVSQYLDAVGIAAEAFDTEIQAIGNNLSDSVNQAYTALINSDAGKDLNLDQASVVGDLLQTAYDKYGKTAMQGVSDMFENLGDDAGEFATVLGELDFSDITVDEFRAKLEETGIVVTESDSDLQKIINTMQQLGAVSTATASEIYAAVQKIISGLSKGDTVSSEDYTTLQSDLGTELTDKFFTVLADGTAMLTGDAEEFQKAAHEITIQPFINEIQSLRAAEVRSDVDTSSVFEGSKNQHISKSRANSQIEALMDLDGAEVSKGELEDLKEVLNSTTSSYEEQIEAAERLDEIMITNAAYFNEETNAAAQLEAQLKLATSAIDGLELKSFIDSGLITDINAMVAGVTVLSQSITDIEGLDQLDTAIETIDIRINESKISAEEATAAYQALSEAFQSAYNNASEALASELGVDVDYLKDYANTIEEILSANNKLGRSEEQLATLSLAMADAAMRQNDAIDDLSSAIDDYGDLLSSLGKTLTQSSKLSLENQKAFNAVGKALKDFFGIKVSNDFIVENLEEIKKLANNDTTALSKLRKEAAKDYIINLKINENDQKKLTDAIDQLGDLEDVEIGASLDDTDFLNTLNEMLISGQMTTEEVANILNALNYSVDFSTIETSYDELFGNLSQTMIDGFSGLADQAAQMAQAIPDGIAAADVDGAMLGLNQKIVDALSPLAEEFEASGMSCAEAWTAAINSADEVLEVHEQDVKASEDVGASSNAKWSFNGDMTTDDGKVTTISGNFEQQTTADGAGGADISIPYIGKGGTSYNGSGATARSGGGSSGGSGGSSGGSGGSSSPAKRTAKTQRFNRYETIENSISDVSKALEKANKAADNLYGADRIAALDEICSKNKDYISLLEQEKKLAEETYLPQDKTDLEEATKKLGNYFGTTFTLEYDDDGHLTTTYDDIAAAIQPKFDAWDEYLNSLSTQEEQDAYKEEVGYDEAEDYLSYWQEYYDQYNDTLDLISDIDDQIADAIGYLERIEDADLSDLVSDFYKDVTTALSDLDRVISRLEEEIARSYGQNKINKINEENAQLEKEIAVLEEKQNRANTLIEKYSNKIATNTAKANEDFAEMIEKMEKSEKVSDSQKNTFIDLLKKATLTVKIDDDKNIINYTELSDLVYDVVEYATIQAQSALNEFEQEYWKGIVEEIEAWWEIVDTVMTSYTEQVETYKDAVDEIQDVQYEIQDNNYEKLTYWLENKLQIIDNDLTLIGLKIDMLGDSVYRLAEKAALMISQIDEYEAKYDTQVTSDEQMYQAYLAEEISEADYYDSVQNSFDNIASIISDILAVDQEMLNYYSDSLSAVADEIGKYTDRLAAYTSRITHFQTLQSLLGSTKDYNTINTILEGKYTTTVNELQVIKNSYDMYKDQETQIAAQLATFDQDADPYGWEMLKNEYDAITAQVNQAEDEYLSKLEEVAESAKEIVTQKFAEIQDAWEEMITSGLKDINNLSDLATSMDRTKSLQEEYLTTTNQIYETTKLMRTATQALESTTNKAAKNKLNAFIAETDELKNQNKLSEYELKIQQAKYDLLVAEIALEEAKNAKSTVRMSRDSEGNWGYIYTADQDTINDALQNYEDKMNVLYNLYLDGANDYAEKYAETMQSWTDELAEMYENWLNGQYESDEAYLEDVAKCNDYYTELLTQYGDLWQIALEDDIGQVEDAWSTNYLSMINTEAVWKEYTTQYTAECLDAINAYNSRVTVISENLEESYGDVTSAIKETTKASDALANEANTVVDRLGEELTAVNELTYAYAQQRDTLYELLNAKLEYMAALNATLSEASVDDIDYSFLMTQHVLNGGSTEDEEYKTWESDRIEKTENDPSVTDVSTDRLTAALTAYHDGTATEAQKEYIESIGELYGNNWYTDKDMTAVGLATGGYTGEWGPEGKLAFLHQKELVLNASDTENLLSAVEMIRAISQTIDLNAQSAAAGFEAMLQTAIPQTESQVLEQEVTIHAEFPNVTDKNEIQEALNTLVNAASQYANRK